MFVIQDQKSQVQPAWSLYEILPFQAFRDDRCNVSGRPLGPFGTGRKALDLPEGEKVKEMSRRLRNLGTSSNDLLEDEHDTCRARFGVSSKLARTSMRSEMALSVEHGAVSNPSEYVFIGIPTIVYIY